MMLNENPVPPIGTRSSPPSPTWREGQPLPGPRLSPAREARQAARLAAENIALANGSSETIDAMMRIFLQPGDEFLCSNPTFEMFPSRAGYCKREDRADPAA